MRKVVFSIIMASSLAFGIGTSDIEASSHKVQTGDALTKVTVSTPVIQKVSSAKATAKSGTYKTKYNTNIRTDAGTKNRVVTLAKKGTTVKATHQKKVGKEVWYKVNANGKSGWILSSLLTGVAVKKASNPTASNDFSSSVVNRAMALRGIPYVFGGTTTNGFDCSGYIQYAFKQAGKNVSRTTIGQFAETTQVSSPQPGDLVFFQNTYKPGISHVGIYIGNNQFVHAGGKQSEVKSLNDSYWKTKFHSFKQF